MGNGHLAANGVDMISVTRIPLRHMGLFALSMGLFVRSAAVFAEDAGAFFEQQVRPLLQEKCWRCHGTGKELRGGLNLTRREDLLKGGEQGAAVDLEHPDESLLLQAVNYDGLEMPPDGQLSAAQIRIFREWIAMGVPWSAHTDAPAPPTETDRLKAGASHWAFQPLQRPAVPQSNSEWVANPIDAFVLQKLTGQKLFPNEPAQRAALIRRATFDLTGLPPTPEDVAAFLKDTTSQAYERLIDRLLESPHYGEHWGRHWLDLVRFAETNSFERDNPKPHVWRYRDYVIKSFNQDKPYDQFLTEQLAGDELDEVSADSIIATGYYRLGLWDDEPTDAVQAYYDNLDDVVSVTSQVFMGLTLNCARCHEHKIDPISQEDYYRFLAFFHNIYRDTTSEGELAFKKAFTLNTERSLGSAEQVAAYEAYRREFLERQQGTTERIAAFERQIMETFSAPEREDAKDEHVRKRLLANKGPAALGDADWQEYERLQQQIAETLREPEYGTALAVRENGPQAPETFVLLRGSAHAQGAKVEPGYPQVLGFADPVIPPSSADSLSSGRRRVIAEWLADPRHPLTARVMANRLWQFHFGRGIVSTSSDFGLQGASPTHPELLDWLASELIAGKWRLKRIHKLIMTSRTYQLSSQPQSRALEIDPDNRLFWRVNLRRLSAEEIRDSVLHVNGTLNTRYGGPSVYPKIPAAVMQGQSQPGYGWPVSAEADQARRSVYVHVKRSLPLPVLASFDAPDTDFSCPVRFSTIQPTQALGMLNSDFFNEQASRLAERLRGDVRNKPAADTCSDPAEQTAAQVTRGLQLVLTREPSPQEIEWGTALLRDLTRDHQVNPDQALDQFCLMLLNLNEFVYID